MLGSVAEKTATILFIFGTAAIFSYLVTLEHIPEMLRNFIINFTDKADSLCICLRTEYRINRIDNISNVSRSTNQSYMSCLNLGEIEDAIHQ